MTRLGTPVSCSAHRKKLAERKFRRIEVGTKLFPLLFAIKRDKLFICTRKAAKYCDICLWQGRTNVFCLLSAELWFSTFSNADGDADGEGQRTFWVVFGSVLDECDNKQVSARSFWWFMWCVGLGWNFCCFWQQTQSQIYDVGVQVVGADFSQFNLMLDSSSIHQHHYCTVSSPFLRSQLPPTQEILSGTNKH